MGLWTREGSSADCEGREEQLGRSAGRGREQAPAGCKTSARHHRLQQPAAVQSPWLLLPRSSRAEHLTAKATVIDTDVKGKRPCLLLLGGFRSFPGDSNTLPGLGATAGEGT